MPLHPPLRASIIAPSAPVTHVPQRAAQFDAGLARLETLGLLPSVSAHAREHSSYVSAPIAARLEDLHAAYTDPATSLIIAANGGRNCNQLVPYLDEDLLRAYPKPLLGFSDITVLLHALWRITGRVQYHGPMVAWGFDDANDARERSVLAALAGAPQSWDTSEFGTFLRGSALEGQLIGGNLASFLALVGTPYAPAWNDAVLFFEECEEPTSRFDRMLTQLECAGAFQHLRGIVVGHLDAMETMEMGTSTQPLDVLLERTARWNIPILVTERFGHPRPEITFPVGGRIRADQTQVTVV